MRCISMYAHTLTLILTTNLTQLKRATRKKGGLSPVRRDHGITVMRSTVACTVDYVQTDTPSCAGRITASQHHFPHGPRPASRTDGRWTDGRMDGGNQPTDRQTDRQAASMHLRSVVGRGLVTALASRLLIPLVCSLIPCLSPLQLSYLLCSRGTQRQPRSKLALAGLCFRPSRGTPCLKKY